MPRLNIITETPYLNIKQGDRVCIRKPGSTEERYIWARDDASGCFTNEDMIKGTNNHEGIHLTGICGVPDFVAADEWWELVEIEKAFPCDLY